MLVLGDIIRRNAKVRPNKTAIIFERNQLTYGQLNDQVNRFANALLSLGIKRGDRVGLLMRNSHLFVTVYFAVIKIGAILVPINFWYRGPETTFVVNKSGVSTFILAEEFIDPVEGIKKDLKPVQRYIVIGQKTPRGMLSFDALMASSSNREPSAEVHENDPHLILFTSGTTGVPKGAVITQRNYFLLSGIHSQYMRIEEDDTYMNVYPMFHMGGAPLSVFPVFYVGATLVIVSTPPTPEKMLKAIQDCRVTHFMAVPTLWRRLLEYPQFDQYDLSSLKVAMGASDSMPKDLLGEVLKRCPASSPQLYGLSEGGIITYLKPDESMKKIGSSGKPHSQCEIRLVDDNDRDVPPGSVGEIICRGEHIMSHYWDMPEETKNALRGGWLHTGDLGRFDEEGYIYIVGRKKDMIISGGQNIYPAEVEKLLLQHAKIEEAAVIGIPDKEWGETVMAIVAPKKGEKLTEDEVINYVKENLASYNKPRFVRFMDALPRTSATGKIQKSELRKQISEEMNRKK